MLWLIAISRLERCTWLVVWPLFFSSLCSRTTGKNDILTLLAFASLALGTLIGGPTLAGGRALLRRENWGRGVGIGLAILMLFAFPIGTALAIYMLWVLSNAKCIALFHKGETE